MSYCTAYFPPAAEGRAMFEFLKSLVLIIFCWFLSVLLFAPFTVRKFLSRNRPKYLAKLYAATAADIAMATRPYVETAFKSMQKHCRKTSRNISTWRILEIGVGTGVNFFYYPERSTVICVDNNPHYSNYLVESLSCNPHVSLERMLTTSADDMHEVPDGIVDCVVSTYTLCAVDNVDAVLQEIKRVLRPGGCMLFVEPVGDDETSWNSVLQKIASPLFVLYFGCRINRNLSENLISANFRRLKCTIIHPEGFNLCVKPHISGIAIK